MWMDIGLCVIGLIIFWFIEWNEYIKVNKELIEVKMYNKQLKEYLNNIEINI